MSQDKGEMKREHFGRKLYLVPLILSLEKGPEGYAEKVATYWDEAIQHVRNLEARFGRAAKIYHESVPFDGERGLKLIEQLNPDAHRFINRRCLRGAQFVTVENGDLLQETLDWQRCLSIVLSPTVIQRVSAFYQEARRKRYEHMSRVIDETLGDEEAAILFIGREHAVQFPPDIQVFYVAPPSLDEIDRLLREEATKSRTPPSRENSNEHDER